jgi:RNA polymerase sigma-70 factor (ECF subfamily)
MEQSSQIVDLLNRARAGDEAARDELFQKCRNYVAIVARAQVEDWMRAKVDASDLVQQTLLEAHVGFKNFQGSTEAEWLAWLRRILTHNAADFVRQFKGRSKRRSQQEVPLQMPAGGALSDCFLDPPDPGDSPSQLVLQHERELEVAEAITQLAPDYQEVIMLRNLQRLSFNDVADRMGRSRPATQMLWLRALRKLKEILDETSEPD